LGDVKAKHGGITAGIMKKLRSGLFYMDNSGVCGLIDAACETVGRVSAFRWLKLVKHKAL
jgi:hypothetical protein